MCAVSSVPAMAQFNLKKAISGAVKATQAVTLTDEQMSEYVKEYILGWMPTIRFAQMTMNIPFA